jgi:glutathione-regulated potassium-efflux system ancillary protein KefG
MLKQWTDLVLEHNWAYGSKGNALRGKQLLNAITAGGREQAYQPDGYNRFTIRQFLAPIEQTAVLCGLRYLPPFVLYGTHRMESPDIQRAAACYRQLLMGLRDETVTAETLDQHAVLTPDLIEALFEGVPAHEQ